MFKLTYEPGHEISNNVVCVTSKASDQHAQKCSLIRDVEYSMAVKLLTEQHLEFLSLKGGCTGLSESTLPHCWKSHVVVHIRKNT